MPTTITTNSDVTTLINVFTVDPADQERVLDTLIEATDKYIRHIPGFIAANFHASTDGTRVVNYAQWASPEDWKAMLADPDCAAHIGEVMRISQPEYHLYRVVSTHTED